mmetsp:Transcript_43095/g.106372  ORF Transcript_43095/g.106372 Transcript_43095/m.106372 type:complete len:217 (-) Transcript_43095:24-674(-)
MTRWPITCARSRPPGCGRKPGEPDTAACSTTPQPAHRPSGTSNVASKAGISARGWRGATMRAKGFAAAATSSSSSSPSEKSANSSLSNSPSSFGFEPGDVASAVVAGGIHAPSCTTIFALPMLPLPPATARIRCREMAGTCGAGSARPRAGAWASRTEHRRAAAGRTSRPPSAASVCSAIRSATRCMDGRPSRAGRSRRGLGVSGELGWPGLLVDE